MDPQEAIDLAEQLHGATAKGILAGTIILHELSPEQQEGIRILVRRINERSVEARVFLGPKLTALIDDLNKEL